MLRVWVNRKPVGRLARLGQSGSSFTYDEGVDSRDAISLTQPVRPHSWNTDHHLAPIFDMNLPEGALREQLRLRFAKSLRSFDDFGLLQLVGSSQIGRLRYTPIDRDLDDEVPFQSVQDILRARREGDLFEYLIRKFATYSGVAGVQPKVMFRGDDEARQSQSVKSATHIVKFWEKDEYPELAANEYFCLRAAKELGLVVPDFSLSDDGSALVVQRFDMLDGVPQGFEDMAVLNAKSSAQKYEGGYETALFKRVREFVSPDAAMASMESLFRLFVLNCAVRNGDAHLKNFGVIYSDAESPVQLAPVFDVVTTKAYLPVDMMALSLDGTKRWPIPKKLLGLGQMRAFLSRPKVLEIFEQTADVLSDTAHLAREYFRDCPHPEVGNAMMDAWQEGVRDTLGLTHDYQHGHVLIEDEAPSVAGRSSPPPAELSP
jgi:HipA N-terminal domain